MCGSLRHSKWKPTQAPIRVGSTLPTGSFKIQGIPSPNPLQWNGFAREESLPDWTSKGWKEGVLEVEEYTEQGKSFKLPPGKGIKVLALFKNGKEYLNIVTRAAQSQLEKATHPRFPKEEDL